MLVFIFACAGSAFAVSILMTGVMRWVAPRIGLIDQPATRKVHLKAKPLGGGIAIYLGVVIPLFIGLGIAYSLEQSTPTSQGGLIAATIKALSLENLLSNLSPGILYRTELLWKILAGGTVLVVLGLVDDFRNISWWIRLSIQAIIAGWLVSSGVAVTLFLDFPMLTSLLSVLWIMVLINAFNFLDNMDGLTSGVGLISATMFAALMLSHPSEPRWLVAGLLLTIVGSLAGFLFHNWSPAKIFMGDAGSTFIGLAMAATTMLGTYYTTTESSQHAVLAPLCILAVPLYDFTSVILIRLFEGRSPFQPDKKHFSHRLVALGLNSWQAVLTIHLTTLITGLAGILLFHAASWFTAITALLLTAGVLLLIAILEMAAAAKARSVAEANNINSPDNSANTFNNET